MALSIVNNPTAIGAQGGVNSVNSKLAKRTYLDMAKTTQAVTYNNGIYYDNVFIAKNDSSDGYNLELSTENVEVGNG